ncbi:MAG TPA: FAD:protein FMN transferase [Accumulibacter sp.]|nr:FAD:protein FMN transferase [Accumulibacter sp.]HMW16666.1 FAD:protein FMN transferase [Accumulibacter sp.]HMX22679.1 FAD:protein FMN transferase [Accumulibacter sp.]HMY07096.1 FAD:protein FMN transferase [Accumulibacter sp.]HNC17691.1 FAD:protein FMN transferase [Accumulibacter sp.]
MLLFLAACGQESVHRQESFVFGTRVEVTIAGLPADAARTAAATVLREFDRLHRTYHAWKPSELSALNEALAAGRPTQVSSEMAALLNDAQRLSRISEHLFDPGIGRLIALWGFQSDDLPITLPDQRALAGWLASRPGIRDLSIEGQWVRSRNRGVAIDFGGYLKGVALDRASELLRAQGVRNALINIGGNVMALGTRQGEPWRVGIQHPRQTGALATIELADGEAIGTSGDYQRYLDVAGKRYCHLLDPRNAAPVTHTQALTVLIPAGEQAGTRSDVWSKPLFIAGDDWPRLARRLDATQVLRVDAAGRLQVTAALQRRLVYVGREPANREIIP